MLFRSIVQQIVLVLLNNAIEASLESSKSLITLGATCSSGEVLISVGDFGEGISEKVIGELFKEIVVSKKEKGSGLGLYFANQLAKSKIGGYVKVINKKNPTVFALYFRES